MTYYRAGTLMIHTVSIQLQHSLKISVYIASLVPYFTLQSSRDQAMLPLDPFVVLVIHILRKGVGRYKFWRYTSGYNSL